MEADDVNTLLSFKRYQNLIPRCYEADCYHCNEGIHQKKKHILFLYFLNKVIRVKYDYRYCKFKIISSAQRGLLGNVFPELRAVCVDSKENLIQVYFYIDREITDEKKECCESVLDDIIGDFFVATAEEKDEIEFETPFIRLDYPEKPKLIGHWVYYRHELVDSLRGT